MTDPTHEWRSSPPGAEGTATWYDYDEMLDVDDVEPGHVVWRRSIKYGPWERVVVPHNDGSPLRPFSGICGVEGRATEDGRMLDMGSIKLPHKPVPLAGKQPARELVGRIDKVTRHGIYLSIDGVTSLEPGEYGVALELMNMATTMEEGNVTRITSADIMGVAVVDNPSWPNHCKIEVSEQ